MIGRGKTDPILDSQGNKIPSSIASLETVTLGGVDQSILIRGKNQNNPILLFLHGGLGGPVMAWRTMQAELEEHFVVVNWDQRGAGKSYSADLDPSTISLKQIETDGHELVELLRSRFHAEKIYLVGHSWGTALGSRMAQEHPESFYAYIGISQVVNTEAGAKLDYQFTLEEAKRRGNQQALDELEPLGPPLYENREHTRTVIKWVQEFGGARHQPASFSEELQPYLAPEYDFFDWVHYMKGGMTTSQSPVSDDMKKANLFEQVPELKIPVYILHGKHDYQTPHSLAKQYLEALNAPKKNLITLENSAHYPTLEETDRVNEILIQTILPETYAK